MPNVDLRLLRQMWRDNPPSVLILFGVVFIIVGYAWMWWLGGVVFLVLGIALLFGGGGYEIAWLRRRRRMLTRR